MTASYQQAKRDSTSRQGVGLGLRWDFLDEVLAASKLDVAFWEVSPENYMRRGGYFPAALEELKERYAFICHGLTMSVGAVDAPSGEYLEQLGAEIRRMASPYHSDHLCLSTAGPLVLHELLPLARTRSAVGQVADRIKLIEDELAMPFVVENISYYAEPSQPELSELDFICEVLHRADCGLLLDINNVFVNSKNHGFDPGDFIRGLPLDRVVQIHIAGHTMLAPPHPAAGLILDTHGSKVIDPVKELMKDTLELVGAVPVLLERDNNFPELSELLVEVHELQKIYEDTIGER